MIRGFDNEAFQAKVDRIVGKNRDGKSIIRLSYAPTVMTYAFGEHVPRYWIRRWKEDGEWKYEQPERWVFEKRLEKGVYWDAHNANRFQTIEATGDVIDLGPPPEDYYIFDSLIAVHDTLMGDSGEPLCCERAWRGEEKMTVNSRLELVSTTVGGRKQCWGRYREPDETDLERVRQAVKRMHSEKYSDPYKPLSPEQLLLVEMEGNLQVQRMAEEAQARIAALNADFNRSHAWRLRETNAGRLTHGRFHFLNSGRRV